MNIDPPLLCMSSQLFPVITMRYPVLELSEASLDNNTSIADCILPRHCCNELETRSELNPISIILATSSSFTTWRTKKYFVLHICSISGKRDFLQSTGKWAHQKINNLQWLVFYEKFSMGSQEMGFIWLQLHYYIVQNNWNRLAVYSCLTRYPHGRMFSVNRTSARNELRIFTLVTSLLKWDVERGWYIEPLPENYTIRHGLKPGCHEAKALILEAEALTLFNLEAKAFVTKLNPKPGFWYM